MRSKVSIIIAAVVIASQAVSAHCTSATFPFSQHPPNNPQLHSSAQPTTPSGNPQHATPAIKPPLTKNAFHSPAAVSRRQTDVLDVVAGDSLEFAHVREYSEEWSSGARECEGGAGAYYQGRTRFVRISSSSLVGEDEGM